MKQSKICPICNKKFTTYRSLQINCSRKCYEKSDSRKQTIKKHNQSDKRKESRKKYKESSDKYKKYMKEYLKKYSMTDKNKNYRSDYQKSSDKYKKYQKEYRQTEKYKEDQRKYAKTDKRIQYKKEYRQSDKYKESMRKYFAKRKKSDPMFKLQATMRQRIGNFLKVKKMIKKNKTFEMIGCTPKFLKKYLEKKFYPHPKTNEKMNWKNHSIKGWHVDHIRPLDLAKTPEEAESLSHYTNLQPLWAEENLKKKNKII
jgi:hypothetical protein